MKAASRIVHPGFHRLGRQFKPAEIKVSKAEPDQRKRPHVSTSHKGDGAAGFLFIKREPFFEVSPGVLELADVQTGGAGFVVTDHRAERVNATTQKWLGKLEDLRRLRPDQVIIAKGAEGPERFKRIRCFFE